MELCPNDFSCEREGFQKKKLDICPPTLFLKKLTNYFLFLAPTGAQERLILVRPFGPSLS